MATLERDPWGRPYQVVVQQVKPRSLAVTEKMEIRTITRVVEGLFPKYIGAEAPCTLLGPNLVDVDPITMDEIKAAIKDSKKPNSAPGPDGITVRVLLVLLSVAPNRLQDCLNACLLQGCFPWHWKRARLVLVPKVGKPHGLPSSYRPLCLLNEIGKFYERILARRMLAQVDASGGFSSRQFGFCRGKSTCDAVAALEEIVSRSLSRRGVCVAVSLDIRNAFNSLPWPVIRDALVWWRMPQYIRLIIADYLRRRYIEYAVQGGARRRTRVVCGVPQGSVLGPLLWNITYDLILRLQVPTSCKVLCYADDTLVVAEGRNLPSVISSVNRGLLATIRDIRALGLSIAPDKTEAVIFRSRRCRAPLLPVRLGEVEIMPRPFITYLGILLDEFWTFSANFQSICDRGRRVGAMLARIMPNLGGSTERHRVLYLHVLHAVLLYGAPIWAGKLASNKPAYRRVSCGSKADGH